VLVTANGQLLLKTLQEGEGHATRVNLEPRRANVEPVQIVVIPLF